MTRASRLADRRRRTRLRTLAVVVVAFVVASVGSVAFAAVSSHPSLYACFGDTDGKAKSGLSEYATKCGPTSHLKRIAAQDVPATPTTRPTSTTQAPSGVIVPAGPNCPNSSASSTYEGKTLTVAQAVQALWAGGFRSVDDLRAFVGIGRAESSLCVRTWHHHGGGVDDRGWLQINSRAWPQFSEAQVLDPVGAAKAAFVILMETDSRTTWDTFPNPATSQEPSVAQVCAVEPSATRC